MRNLHNIEFTNDSELNSTDDHAFYETSISNIIIPSHVKHIVSYAFNGCGKLQNVEFSNDSELNSIHDHALSDTLISNIKIPSLLNILDSVVFSKILYRLINELKP